MKQSGRTSLIALAAAVGVIIVIFIMMFGQESLTSVGARFMSALAKGDVETLTKMSVLGNTSQDQLQKEWDFAVHTAGRHYAFKWRITSSMQQTPTAGAVMMQISRNAASPGTYDEGFQLPLQKVNGVWKVDVRGISREMYPDLPR
jgi:hypothetical protein